MTLVEGDQKAPFSIATTRRCWVRAQLLSQNFSTLPLIRTLYCRVFSKEVSSTIFKVFGMTRPGIEPRSPRSLANTLPTRPMTSHFIWNGCVREGVGDRTELQHIDPHSYGHNCFFPVLLCCSTGGLGPTQLGAGFLYRILSPTATAQSGAWGPYSAGCWLSLPLLSPTEWTSCTLSYIIVQRKPSSCGCHK